MHIARLRTKLRDPSGCAPEAILTVRSHGYMAGPDLLPADAPTPRASEIA
jgi:hypothetical protein